MKPIFFIFSLLFAPILPAYAAETRVPFPHLETFEIDSHPFKIRIFYDPANTTIFDYEVRESEFRLTRVLTTRIDKNKKQEYEVRYSEGPSADPAFFIHKKSDENELGVFSGTELYIPGNGAIYVSGHTNNLFNQRRKFDLKNGRFVEVKQPYYYVGLESKAEQDITIYAEKTLETPVANIPAGANLSVVLNEGKLFLIKTQFGLLGWIQYESGAPFDHRIEGLFYMGD